MRFSDTSNISPEWTTVGFWFRNLLDTAELLGCDRNQLMAQAELDPSILTQLDKHYPIKGFFQLFEMIHSQCHEDDIGIRHILNGHPCSVGLVGMTAFAAPTLRVAWETVFRYRHLIMNTGNSRLLDEGNTTTIRWYPFSRALITERYFVDTIIAGWVQHSRALTRKKIMPVSSSLTYGKVALTPLFIDTYGDNVRFNQPYNSVTFQREDVDAALYYADKKVFRTLCAQADQEIIHAKAEILFSEKVEFEIRQQLTKGEASVEIIAEQMHVSPRTLQRRLTREDTSFHDLLGNVRHELALFYLQEENLSTLDVALRLGYNQASSFCTAFKSWTGQTPSEYRGTEKSQYN